MCLSPKWLKVFAINFAPKQLLTNWPHVFHVLSRFALAFARLKNVKK